MLKQTCGDHETAVATYPLTLECLSSAIQPSAPPYLPGGTPISEVAPPSYDAATVSGYIRHQYPNENSGTEPNG